MTELNQSFTSTGHKFFAHQEAMMKLRNGHGQPIVSHVMLTDVCNHTCAFCSVQARQGDSLPFDDVMGYLDLLLAKGLKAVILSGGGNPILYKSGGKNFNDVVDAIHSRGLEIGLITNGMSLKKFEVPARRIPTRDPDEIVNFGDGEHRYGDRYCPGCGCWYSNCVCNEKVIRESWAAVRPATLDKCTWIRISMSGLDHEEREVFVPDVGPNTTLGFSYVGHDIYVEPADPHHGKVSTRADLLSGDRAPDLSFELRVPHLTEEIAKYVCRYKPRYVRLLPNCLEPDLILRRCETLAKMAKQINLYANSEIAFVQNKPPKAPHACYLGYVHPVLNCDGYVYPCDSCVLNEAAGHQFANPWRMCHWKDIASIYEQPIRSLIADPAKLCPGCVFSGSNELLRTVVEGAPSETPSEVPEHANFV